MKENELEEWISMGGAVGLQCNDRVRFAHEFLNADAEVAEFAENSFKKHSRRAAELNHISAHKVERFLRELCNFASPR